MMLKLVSDNLFKDAALNEPNCANVSVCSVQWSTKSSWDVGAYLINELRECINILTRLWLLWPKKPWHYFFPTAKAAVAIVILTNVIKLLHLQKQPSSSNRRIRTHTPVIHWYASIMLQQKLWIYSMHVVCSVSLSHTHTHPHKHTHNTVTEWDHFDGWKQTTNPEAVTQHQLSSPSLFWLPLQSHDTETSHACATAVLTVPPKPQSSVYIQYVLTTHYNPTVS